MKKKLRILGTTTNMIVLAIDPGIEKIGYSIFESQKSLHNLIGHGLIKTDRKDKDELRLLRLYEKIDKLIIKYSPDVIACEKIFLFKNHKTIVPVDQSQGIVMLAAAQNNITLQFLTPLQIKQTITGYGNADKKSVHKMLSLILKSDIKVADDDESDAIACGLAYCYLSKSFVQ